MDAPALRRGRRFSCVREGPCSCPSGIPADGRLSLWPSDAARGWDPGPARLSREARAGGAGSRPAKWREVIPLALRFLLGALIAAFAAFVAAHYWRPTLRQQAVGWLGGYVLLFVTLAAVPDPTRVAWLGRLAWIFSAAPTWGHSWLPLVLGCVAFALVVARFVPGYQARGLGPQQGTIRSVPFPFKAVSLTFDDGPSPEWTPRVLEVLERHRVKATFFMVGQAVEQYPDLVRDVRRRGHAVGSHSHTHRCLPLLDEASLRWELDSADAALEKVLGQRPQFFRPPWGFFTRRVLDEARSRGYLTVLWTRSTQDWRNAGVDGIVDLATRGEMGAGEILLLHDGGNYPGAGNSSRQQTVEALDRLIPALEARGYQFKSVEEAIQAWVS